MKSHFEACEIRLCTGAKELSHSHVNQNESQRFTFNPLRLSMIDPYGGLATIRKSTTANGAALTDPRDTAVQRDMQVGSKRWHFLLVWIERCHEARATEVRFKPGGEVWRGEWQKEGWRHAHNAFLSPFTNGPEATWNLNPFDLTMRVHTNIITQLFVSKCRSEIIRKELCCGKLWPQNHHPRHHKEMRT